MNFDPASDDSFFEYDPDIEPGEDAREKKINRLKKAIENGNYDVDGQLGQLMRNLESGIAGMSEAENEDTEE